LKKLPKRHNATIHLVRVRQLMEPFEGWGDSIRSKFPTCV
jgi:hypothetical protein